jgi:hypothetical protein
VHWAIAAWETWLPRGALLRLAAEAKRTLAAAPNVWAAVRGPGAAFVASAARLGWTVHDAFSVTTDDGTALRFTSDPPARVKREVTASVRRWRWRRVEDRIPTVAAGGGGSGAHITPILRLLRKRGADDAWTAAHRGGLRSAVLNRQWPQARLFRAGLAAHNGCHLCELANSCSSTEQSGAQPLVLAPGPTPEGTLLHRIARCQSLEPARLAHVPLLHLEELRRAADSAVAGEVVNGAWLTRALSPSLASLVPPPPARSSFAWERAVPDDVDLAQCTVYTDGSMHDGPPKFDSLCARLGWSMVLVGDDGLIIASAHGVPPPFVRSVPAAEAWALAEAARTFGSSPRFRVDCLGVVQAYQSGRKRATSAARGDADIWAAIFTAWDDEVNVDVAWMPAHTSEADVGRLALSNGDSLTETDRIGNGEADRLAKSAAHATRVSAEVKLRITRASDRVAMHATWIGVATALAGRMPLAAGGTARDSAPAARRSSARDTGPLPKRARLAPAVRPAELGGHVVRKRGLHSVCTQCLGASCDHRAFAAKRCRGSAVLLWAQRAARDAEAAVEDGGGHVRRLTAGVLWCDACGAFAEERARGLARPCRGHPSEETASRRRDRLRAGRHPVTGAVLVGTTVREPSSFLDTAAAGAAPCVGARAPAPGVPPEPSTRMAALLARVRARAVAAGGMG